MYIRVKDARVCDNCVHGVHGPLSDVDIVHCRYIGMCDNAYKVSKPIVDDTTIDDVISCLECGYDCEVSCLNDDGIIYNVFAKNTFLTMQVIRPGNGNDNWTLWVSSLTAFDKWSNSIAHEEQCKTLGELLCHLMYNRVEIYEDVISYLCEEYESALDTIKSFQLP